MRVTTLWVKVWEMPAVKIGGKPEGEMFHSLARNWDEGYFRLAPRKRR